MAKSTQVHGKVLRRAVDHWHQGVDRGLHRYHTRVTAGNLGQHGGPTRHLGNANFNLEGGVPTAMNIQIIGGEPPGRQTVPMSELWGAILLVSRVHANVCPRLGVDASYVTQWAYNRLRLEKGSNGEFVGIVFLQSWISVLGN